MENKVSVVVTCYNHEEYIEGCLRSIFKQTYKNIELLVFDDGSTDDSGQIIEKVLKDSPFLGETYYFSSKNRGVTSVRNDALSKIKGEFLLFVDSDNFIDPEHIEWLHHSLTKEGADIAYCQLWDFVHGRNVLRDDLEYSLSKELTGNLIDASSLVRTSKISGLKFDDALNDKALEDYDFWLSMILLKEAKSIFVKETKLNYRVLDTSRTERGNWDKYYQSYFYILDKYVDLIPREIIQALKNNIKIWLKGYEDLEKKACEQDAAIREKDKHIENFQKEVALLKEKLNHQENKLAEKTELIRTFEKSFFYKLYKKRLKVKDIKG
ncbi:glycosyltransferase family 2 protein [Lactococcus garvieae]|uniref:glycosyltransferase family 2 protein n=1 Tax=Lactococcus garvieae TaxID=1363 RepID=UPI00385211FF